MFASLITVIAALYVLIGAAVWLGLKRRRAPDAPLASASVVICARDEERDLPACLESLQRQDLVGITGGVEIILVDDASRDRTPELMEAFAHLSRLPVRVIHMNPPVPGEPTGKWRPLKEGMKLGRGEALLLTDADAVLPPGWIGEHLRRLARSELVAGFARIEGEGLWGKVQSLDWLFLLGVGSAMSRWGLPQAALGKNLSVRRADYEAAGGLDAIGFSLTEDLSIVQAVVRRGGKMDFPLDPALMVSTPGVPTWGEFVHQRRRWASGIRRLHPVGRVSIAVLALRHLAIVIGCLALLPQAFLIWGATAVIDFLILERATRGLGMTSRLLFFPLWEIFNTWTAPVQACAYLSRRRVTWKGRKFTGAEVELAEPQTSAD